MKKNHIRFAAYLLSTVVLFAQTTAWAVQSAPEGQSDLSLPVVQPAEPDKQQTENKEQHAAAGEQIPDDLSGESGGGEEEASEDEIHPAPDIPQESDDSTAGVTPFVAGEESQSRLNDASERMTATVVLFQEGGFSGEQIDPQTATPEELEFEQDIIDAASNYYTTKIDVTKYSFSSDCVDGTSELAEMYFKVLNSNPELFYLTGTVEWGYESGKLMLYPQYRYEPHDIYLIKSDCRSKLRQLEYNVIRSNMTPMEKVLTLHDYMISNTILLEEAEDDSQNSGVQVLINGKGTSSGYAMAMAMVMEYFGITSRYTGSDDMQHAWNRVQLGDQWYHVDVSADESIEQEQKDNGYVGHRYLLLSDEKLKEEGYSEWNQEQIACTDGHYDNFIWRECTSQIQDGIGKGYVLQDSRIWEYDYGTNSKKVIIDAPVEQMLVRYRYICYNDGKSIQAFYTANPSLRMLVAKLEKDDVVTEFYARGDMACYTISSPTGTHPDVNGGHQLEWYQNMQLCPYEKIDGEIHLLHNPFEGKYNSTKIRYNGESFVLMGDFVPSQETAEEIEVEIDGDFKVTCEYDGELGQILVNIDTSRFIDPYGGDNELTLTLGDRSLRFRITTEGTLGRLDNNYEGVLWLHTDNVPKTFTLGTKYEDWDAEIDDYTPIRWDALDVSNSRCWLEGENTEAITSFHYQFLPEQKNIQIEIAANHTLQTPVMLVVELVVEGKRDRYQFWCRTGIEGIALYDYILNGIVESPEIDVLYSIDYDRPTFSTDPTMPKRMDEDGDACSMILCMDGTPIPTSKLGSLKITDVTEGIAVETDSILDEDQEVIRVTVTTPEKRMTGSFSLTLDGKSQTFYITTAHTPLIYADAACTQPLDQIELPMLGESVTTVYLKGGVVGSDIVDEKSVDWNQFPKDWSLSGDRYYAADRAEAEYLPQAKAIKLTLYRQYRPAQRRYFYIDWETETGVEFFWWFDCRLINDMYVCPFDVSEPTAEDGLTKIELLASESDYFMVLDQEKKISDFKVISTSSQAFRASKVQLAGYPALRVSGCGQVPEGLQSITLELPTGERCAFPVWIEADSLKLYFDKEMTQRVKSLTVAKGETISLYTSLENPVPAEEFRSKLRIDSRGTEAWLGRLKWEPEKEGDEIVALEIIITASDKETEYPGKLEWGFLNRRGISSEETIRLPYQVVSSDQMAASGIFSLDLAADRMYALEENSDAAWVRSNIASKSYTYELLDANGEEMLDEEIVGTGCQLRLKNAKGNTVKNAKILLYGDCNGDGTISVFDLLAVKSEILGISRLQGIYAEAADTAKAKGTVDVFDLLALKNHILGISSIQQEPFKN